MAESCSLCGAPIRFATVQGTADTIALNQVPEINGRYAFVGASQDLVAEAKMPGFQGYTPHRDSCPKRA